MDFIRPEDLLDEEHERQICRFQRIPYVAGDRLKWLAWQRFWADHKRRMDERDATARTGPRRRSPKG